jgi:VCBS repeat protein
MNRRRRSWTLAPGFVGLLVLAAVVVLAACGGEEKDRGAEPRPAPAAKTDSACPASDEKLPAVVDIKGNTADWRARLIQALKTPNTTVRLDNTVDMDLSGCAGIYVEKGVILTGEQCVPSRRSEVVTPCGGIKTTNALRSTFVRSAKTFGPRLYTKTRPIPLFNVECSDSHNGDNVRFFGFRVQGPHFGMESGDDNLERGIDISSCVGIEIANMEMSGWSGQAVHVQDPLGRNTNPEAIRIHDNFFHHNQHDGGNGYGVVVRHGAYALIERNVFDFNRHAIAAGGQPGTGYRAHQNLVLKGGGVHGCWAICFTAHEFDVHGSLNCSPILHREHALNCGPAGEEFWVTYNAFQFTKDKAFDLRGYPSKGAYVANNVFAHKSLGDAVHQRLEQAPADAKRISYGPNRLGVDTFGRYGVCDFDGDGTDDLFLATGVTWWYSSGGRMHWVFLNAASEMLGQLALGDFDGDGRCDVFAVHGNDWVISSGGTGQWKSLGTYGVPFDQLAFGNFNPGKTTEVLRRAPDGQWSVVSPGSQDWRAVASSSFPLNQLHFGDFTGDGITDVLAVQGGRWSISKSASEGWQRLNPKLDSRLDGVLVADVNGNGTDDVARVKINVSGAAPTNLRYSAQWQISWEGQSDWTKVTTLDLPAGYTPSVYAFAGRFDPSPGADLLLVDNSRGGRFYSKATNSVSPLNVYAY